MDSGEQQLLAWLRELGESTDPAEIEGRIFARFGDRRAILMTDMVGFSRRTFQLGSVASLVWIQRHRDLALPILERLGAEPCRADADNLFASFPDAALAVEAAVAIRSRLAEFDPELILGQGIGYGDVVWWGRGDLYGHEVNLASKLGEDTAAGGEILLTAAAVENVRGRRAVEVEAMGPIQVGGQGFPYYRLVRI